MNAKQHVPPLITPKGVDVVVNALFSAMTSDLGRPFMGGGRNVRSVVRTWCPLLQDTSDMDVPAFKQRYLPAHFFDRYFYADELGVKANLEAQALEKFEENLLRGSAYTHLRWGQGSFSELNSILESAALEIGHILGDFNTEEWFSLCNHGPNATFGVKREASYLSTKVYTLDGTLPAISLFKCYLAWNTTLRQHLDQWRGETPLPFQEVAGSKLSFVPKKFDSLRTMLIEPTINQFLQLGLGGLIAKKLLKANVDLSTQPEVHRNLVSLVTKYGLPLATIDWSQASDRIWLTLCQKLLPSDWYAVLCDVRSPTTEFHGKTYDLTMAGSMGCGFTFPLQTLLFLCLLRALARERGHEQFVSVFGDDCIIDSSMEDDVKWLAHELDWKLNADKSFFEGGFRESCGCDSFHGSDVRPFMIERPTTMTSRRGLEAWAYGCFNLAAIALGGIDKAPSCLTWLLDFLRDHLKVDEPCVVPERFSVNAGIRLPRMWMAAHVNLSHTVIQHGGDQGFSFKYLGTRIQRVSVPCEPYYIWALMGRGAPRNFVVSHTDKRKSVAAEEAAESDTRPDNLGRVPAKTAVGWKRKEGYVHNWHYLF